MTKKIISLILTLFFFITAIPSLTFASNTEEDSVVREVELLSSLGLINKDLALNPNKPIKRGEFASVICSYINIRPSGEGISSFSDVSEEHKHYASILAVNKYNFMSGSGNGTFGPDNPMSYVQVYKVILNILGYGDIAEVYGGYPTGYITLASKTGINENVNMVDYNAEAKVGDVIKILLNAIDIKLAEHTGIKGDDFFLSTNGNKTILNLYHNIEVGDGTIKATPKYQSVDIDPLMDDEILIDDTTYKIETSNNYEDYFGYNIRFYYSTDKKKIIHIDDYYDSNSIIILNSEDVTKYNGNLFTYADGNKDKKISLPLSCDILYNGRKVIGLSHDDFIKNGTELKFIDAGDDGNIDILSISYSQNYVVKAVSVSNEIIYDMYNSGSLKLKELPSVMFFDEFGNVMDLSELSEYDVVSVFQSKDKKITKIIYSNKETEGTITESNLSEGIIKIDGFEYKIANNFVSNSSMLKLGQSGLFPLDHMGRIAAYKPYQNSYKYAYFITAFTSPGIDGKTYAKMYSQDGEMLELTVSEKIILDGETANGYELVSYLSESSVPKPQLIRYYLKSGELKAVDTLNNVNGGVNDSISVLHSSSTQLMYNAYQYIFGARVPISPSVIVFMIPDDINNDEGYAIRTRSVYTHDRSYSIEAYVSKEGSQIADAIVRGGGSSSGAVDSEAPIFVVDSISHIVDEFGTPTYCLYGFIDGHEGSYVLKDEDVLNNIKSISDTSKTHRLKSGDIVRLGKNGATDKIEEIELCYEKENDYIKNDIDVASNLTSSNRMFRANVYSNSEGIVRLTKNPLEDAGIVLSMMDCEAVAIEKYDIYMYATERGKEKVKLASASDLADYISVGQDFSKVLVFSTYTNPGAIVIIK